MSISESSNEIVQEHNVIKYVFDKLEKYGDKSDLWHIIHGSHIRRHLLRRSRHLSKIYLTSEDFVRQCINELFHDVDQYVTQLYRLIYSQQFYDFIPSINNSNQSKTTFDIIQLQRARHLFTNFKQMNEKDLLQNYYKYINDKLTPKSDLSDEDRQVLLEKCSVDLNNQFHLIENKGKEYLKMNLEKQQVPDLSLIDEMIKLGMIQMKKLPSKEDFERNNSFLRRVFIFNRIKDCYKSFLQNTSDDLIFLYLHQFSNQRINKQLFDLLHLFLKSVSIFFATLSTDSKENIIESIQKIGSFFFFENDSSINDFFSLQTNIDQWTWLLQQFKSLLTTLPMLFTKADVFSQIIHTVMDIVFLYLLKSSETIVQNGSLTTNSCSFDQQFFVYIQIGFYFGIISSILNCLNDQRNSLSTTDLYHLFNLDQNKQNSFKSNEIIDKYFQLIEQFLTEKHFNRNQLPKNPFTTILIQALDTLGILTQSLGITSTIFTQLILLLRSQTTNHIDMNQFYNNEQISIGSLLKFYILYKCKTDIVNLTSKREENDRIWTIVLLEELTEDLINYNNDIQSTKVTEYTYYRRIKSSKQSFVNDRINPYYSLLNLCSQIYLSTNRDSQIGAILGRRIIRTLNSIEMNGNERSFIEFVQIFCNDNCQMSDYHLNKIAKFFCNIVDPQRIFFNSLNLSTINYSRTNRKFETFIYENLIKIEQLLNVEPLYSQNLILSDEDLLISAMNYSLKSGGKRLRPLLILILADLYQIEHRRICPLACGIEYLHTAFLIFNDLPAQSNNDLRRLKLSLHKTTINNQIPFNLCEARAQLAAVDLIAITINLINNGLINNGFSSQSVNQLITNIADLIYDLSIGQFMDLRLRHTQIKEQQEQENLLDKLDQISSFKIGKTIEFLMKSPIILLKCSSEQESIQFERIQQLSRLISILFEMHQHLSNLQQFNQNEEIISIPNTNLTYVSILGIEGTVNRIQLFLNQALDLADQTWPNQSETIKDFIKYIISTNN